MNNSQFQSFEISALKNTAKVVNSLVTKKNKLQDKINELQKELESYIRTINKWEAPIIDRFGYSSEKLVNKVVEDTGKKDKNGNPVKSTKYVLKYSTVIPPYAQNNEDNDDEIVTEKPSELDCNEIKTETETNPNGIISSTEGHNNSQEDITKEEPSEEEVKEMYEDYVTQQAVEEAKIPTTDLPFE